MYCVELIVFAMLAAQGVQSRLLYQDWATSASTSSSPANTSGIGSADNSASQDSANFRGSGTTPLNILVDWSRLLDTDSLLNPEQVGKLKNDYMPTVISRVTNLLSLRGPVSSGPLDQGALDDMKSCADLYDHGPVPEYLDTSEGVGDSNYILILTSTERGCNNDTYNTYDGIVPYGACLVCTSDTQTGRPQAGFIHVCPAVFENILFGGFTRDAVVIDTLIHELFHCLGFGLSPGAWPWRNPDTGNLYDQVVQDASSANGPDWLVTPRVKEYARTYFSCDRLPGGPLDPDGGHWWSPALPRELMTAATFDELEAFFVTRFTLLAMEDSGWYIPNYGAAQEYSTNEGAGCELFNL